MTNRFKWAKWFFSNNSDIAQAQATIQVCNLTNASHFLTMPEIAITDLKKLLEDVEASGYRRDKVDITSIFNENPLSTANQEAHVADSSKNGSTLCAVTHLPTIVSKCQMQLTILPNYKQKKVRKARRQPEHREPSSLGYGNWHRIFWQDLQGRVLLLFH